MDNGYVKYEVKDKLGIITFFHPKSNSLPALILKQLAEAVEYAGQDEKVHTIILQSDGDKAFCAGASFDELIEIETFEKGKEFFMGFARVINAMKKAPKFIIARVHGKAVGGGVGLVAAADYAIAVKDASVKLSEYALGIGPNVVGPAVERKLGRASFSQMSIDFEWYSAEWALNRGLFAKVYATKEELDIELKKLSTKLSQASPTAAKELKTIFWEGTDNWDELLEKRAEISGYLVLSDYTKNYISQFKNKNS
ncbi:MAG TPA: enoyl-CoA hydratase/isomerase family protein [Candidatus Kapabacteria bacterium]|nr:enoyl-CoA hydratase/isomerase family protein [Candidatus Kapabacteria bacterium]